MKLTPPANPNYCATVVRVKNLVPLENCDNIVGMPMFGMQAIVGNDTQVGDLGILFPAECQLSDEYVHANNLYRHVERNLDPEKKGYLEDNRRVQAVKFRGHRSDALFMPLESLAFCRWDENDARASLNEGDEFDTLNGVEICHKYERPYHGSGLHGRHLHHGARVSRVDDRLIPEQFQIVNFFKVEDHLDPTAQVVVTQKLHGTSIRIGNIPVRRKLSWLERVAQRFGVKVQKYEFAMVYGSHHVIKDANNPNQRHFYDEDIWSTEGKKLDGLVPENYVVYGELIGYTAAGAPIQKHYTYDQRPGHCELYVYRVAFVNAEGLSCDLSWDAVKEFCQGAGLKHVPEIVQIEACGLSQVLACLLDKKFTDRLDPMLHPFQAVPLSPDSPCDEGVCLRIEGGVPSIYKAKSPMFLGHETKMLDQDVQDIEAEEALC